jgi:holo-[acyl-carrier protein] synthase
MRLGGIGIDAADIGRFRTPQMRRGERFIRNTFSENEREYCFSYRDPAPHLAGTFAAKEAVRKVYGDKPMALAHIEVRRRPSGKPEIWIKGKRSSTLLTSITHTKTLAISIACNTRI